MPKAIWRDAVLAESEDTEIVDGNHYFPANSLHKEHFRDSSACALADADNSYHVHIKTTPLAGRRTT